MKPIYVPSGKAKEYGDYAINIYTGCPHKCYCCFAPRVLRIDREKFHSCVEPRKNLLKELRKQLENEKITDKLIHLCFTCDPYPTGYDTEITRKVIKVLKDYGNHVQILTKGDGSRDFDLLDSRDWYGVTISGAKIEEEPCASSPFARLTAIMKAKNFGINTWVSFEPVVNPEFVFTVMKLNYNAIDKVKIGKLNYYPSDIDWKRFGKDAEELCQKLGVDYYIKDSLRKEMEDKA